MYLILYCHNIGQTDFSFAECDVLDLDEAYVVRGKWPNREAFLRYIRQEFNDLNDYCVIDLLDKGAQAEQYSTQQLIDIAKEVSEITR